MSTAGRLEEYGEFDDVVPMATHEVRIAILRCGRGAGCEREVRSTLRRALATIVAQQGKLARLEEQRRLTLDTFAKIRDGSLRAMSIVHRGNYTLSVTKREAP